MASGRMMINASIGLRNPEFGKYKSEMAEDGNTILHQIKSMKFASVSKNIQEYFSCPDLSSDASSSHAEFALKLIQTCSKLSYSHQINMDELESLTSAVKQCCCILEKDYQLTDLKKVNIALYHIIISFSQLKAFDHVLALSSHATKWLRLSMRDKSNWNEISIVIQNLYATLWNSAIELEKGELLMKNASYSKQCISLKLRSAALQYLFLEGKDIPFIIDKASKAASWYLTASGSNCECDNVMEFYMSLWHAGMVISSSGPSRDSMIAMFELLFDCQKNIMKLTHKSRILPMLNLVGEDLKIYLANHRENFISVANTVIKTIQLCDDVMAMIFLSDSAVVNEQKIHEHCCAIAALKNSRHAAMSPEARLVDSFINHFGQFLLIVLNCLDMPNDCVLKSISVTSNILEPLIQTYVTATKLQSPAKPSDGNSHKPTLGVWLMTKLVRLNCLAIQYLSGKVEECLLVKANVTCEKLQSVLIFKESATSSEYISAGTEVGNLGIVYFNKGMHDYSVHTLELSCEIFIRCLKFWSHLPKAKEQCLEYLWRRHELLSTCYLMLGKLDDGINAITSGLKWNREKFMSALNIWVKLKCEATKQKLMLVCQRTIKDILEDSSISVPVEHVIEFLWCELRLYFSEKLDMSEVCIPVVQVLLEICQCPLEKSHALLVLAQLIWSKGCEKERLASNCCQRAIELLDPPTGKPTGSDQYMTNLLLASANFWLYQTSVRHVQRIAQEEAKKSPVIPLDEAGKSSNVEQDDDDDANINIAFHHVNLGTEFSVLKPLDKALKLWLSVFAKTSQHTDELLTLMTDLHVAEGLKATAEIYLAAKRMLHAIETLTIARNLARNCQQLKEELQAVSQLVICLTQTRTLNIASHLVTDGDAILCQLSGENDSKTAATRLHFLLAKCEFFLYSGQFHAGFGLLKDIMADPIMKNHTKKCLLLQIEARMLACQYSLLPMREHPDFTSYFASNCDDVVPIIWALHALRGSLALIKHGTLSNGWKPWDGGFLWFKIATVRVMLDATLLVGQLYVEIGAPREASCFLQEQLVLAQEMFLPQRVAELLLLLAQLDALCNNIADCQVKVNALQYHLRGGEQLATLDFEDPVQENASSNRSSLEQDIEEDFLVTQPKMPSRRKLQQQLLQSQLSNIMSSPLLHAWPTMTIPSYFHHLPDCKCLPCQYPTLPILHIEQMSLKMQCLLALDASFQALPSHQDIEKLKTLLTLRHRRASKYLSSLVLSQNPTIAKEDEESISHCDGNSMVSLCSLHKQLSSVFIEQGCYERAKLHTATAVELLEQFTPYPSALYPSLYATLVYQKAVIAFQEWLCGNGGNLSKIQSHTWPGNNPMQMQLWDQGEASSSKHLQKVKVNCIVSTPVSFRSGHRSGKGRPTAYVSSSLCQAPIKKVVPTLMKRYLKTLKTADQITKCTSEERDVSLGTDECPDDNCTIAWNCQANSKCCTGKEDTDKLITLNKHLQGISLCSDDTEKNRHTTDPCLGILKSHKSNSGQNCLSSPFIVKHSAKQGRGRPKCSKDVEATVSGCRYNTRSIMTGSKAEHNKEINRTSLDFCATKIHTRNYPMLNTVQQVNDTLATLNKKNDSTQRRTSKTLKGRHKGCSQKSNRQLEQSSEHFSSTIMIDSVQSMKDFEATEITYESTHVKHAKLANRVQQLSVHYENQETCNSGMQSTTYEAENNGERMEPVPDNPIPSFLLHELEHAIGIIGHYPPSLLYANICLLMAVISGYIQENSSDDFCQEQLRSAYYLSESVAVTLRHQAIISHTKKLRKITEDCLQDHNDQDDQEASQVDTIATNYSLIKNILLFKRPENFIESQAMQSCLGNLPEGWIVVQVNAISDIIGCKRAKGPDLLICRYARGEMPVTAMVSGSTDPQFTRSFLKEFDSVLGQSSATMEKKDPKEWWTVRRALDDHLKELTATMENTWLGCWKGLFWGASNNYNYNQQLCYAVHSVLTTASDLGLVCISDSLLKVVVHSASQLSNDHVATAVTCLWNLAPSDPAHSQMCSALLGAAEKCSLPIDTQQPILLVLDKHIQALPWESMPILRNQQVSRVPSLRLLQFQLESSLHNDCVFSNGADCRKTFYILNPSNDIPHTQEKFERTFSQVDGWKGIVGRAPERNEIASAITDHDVFLYCGHGTGRLYLRGDCIERISCRAVAVLMGCSSGKLKEYGHRLEPSGMVLQYWLGGSPCVVANLWDVTDKDIDRFTEALLKTWFPNWSTQNDTHRNQCLTHAVAKARNACKLQHLIGSSPVVYGLPVIAVSKSCRLHKREIEDQACIKLDKF